MSLLALLRMSQMTLQYVLIVMLLSAAIAFADDNIIERAKSSNWIPDLSITYSCTDENKQVIWANVSWDFDELIFRHKAIWAIKICRLKREEKRLNVEQQLINLHEKIAFEG